MPVGVLLSECPHALPPQNNRISWGPLRTSKHEQLL